MVGTPDWRKLSTLVDNALSVKATGALLALLALPMGRRKLAAVGKTGRVSGKYLGTYDKATALPSTSASLIGTFCPGDAGELGVHDSSWLEDGSGRILIGRGLTQSRTN